MPSSDLALPVRNFLELIKAPPASKTARLQALAAALDHLAYAYHGLTGTDFDYDVTDHPPDWHQKAYREIGARFPELGFYSVVESKGIDESPALGDAIDDLIDIDAELRDVLALWDLGSHQVAANQYLWGYRFHWGRHLLDLRKHLHALLYEL
jgi:hypothetical protein